MFYEEKLITPRTKQYGGSSTLDIRIPPKLAVVNVCSEGSLFNATGTDTALGSYWARSLTGFTLKGRWRAPYPAHGSRGVVASEVSFLNTSCCVLAFGRLVKDSIVARSFFWPNHHTQVIFATFILCVCTRFATVYIWWAPGGVHSNYCTIHGATCDTRTSIRPTASPRGFLFHFVGVTLLFVVGAPPLPFLCDPELFLLTCDASLNLKLTFRSKPHTRRYLFEN